jgi:methyl-accepting chemotaxis protein
MQRLADMKLSRKLMLVFGGAMLLIGSMAAFGIWSLQAVETAVNQSQFETENLLLANKFSNETGRVLMLVGTSVLRGGSSPEDRSELGKLRESYRTVLDKLRGRISAAEGRSLMDQWEQQSAGTKSANLRVTELNKAHKTAEAGKAFLNGSMAAYDARDATIQQFLHWQERRLAESTEQRATLISRSTSILMTVAVLVMVGCALAGMLLTRGISRPLTAAVSRLDDVARGDVSQDIASDELERGDEMGALAKSMQTMSRNLRGMIGDINDGIRVLSSSSAELSANSSQMSGGIP